MSELFTIGHSNHAIETFIDLLRQHQVTAIADVRSSPYSRYLPHFTRAALEQVLTEAGIRYVFLGRELGARPDNPDCYVDGKALYDKIAATEAFEQGLQRLRKGIQTHRIALMCAEQDPIACHRAILICPHLKQFDFNINHILKNGDLETHDRLEERMLEKHGFAQPKDSQQLTLFDLDRFNNLPSREECLAIAYQRQGLQIAYVEK